MRDGLAVDLGLCRIWRDHGRDISWNTSGSDGIPSGLTEIPQNTEFLSRWDHGKSCRDWGGIPTGSRRDLGGIPSGSRKIPSFYPAGIPVNPDGIPVNPDGIPVNPDGIPTISRSNPTKSRQNSGGIPVGIPSFYPGKSHRDPNRDPSGIPPGFPPIFSLGLPFTPKKYQKFQTPQKKYLNFCNPQKISRFCIFTLRKDHKIHRNNP